MKLNIHKIAYLYLKQEKWEDAIQKGLEAISLNHQYTPTLDLLAHAYGALTNWEKAGYYGHLSLTYKDKTIPVPTEPMIPESPCHNGKRIISFSLFGNHSKYIEPSILNTQIFWVYFRIGFVVFILIILFLNRQSNV